MIRKFICHGHPVQQIARKHGWLPGARYTNIRDIRRIGKLFFLDIDWEHYDFEYHLSIAKEWNPYLTVARDITRDSDLEHVIREAENLFRYCKNVAIVPKAPSMAPFMEKEIPRKFIFGYSVPSKYGETKIDPLNFRRPVHLLGGRPDRQFEIAKNLNVVSFDCNRFALDAAFGDYFDGERFRPHPLGGYDICLKDSLRNINKLWRGYKKQEILPTGTSSYNGE